MPKTMSGFHLEVKTEAMVVLVVVEAGVVMDDVVEEVVDDDIWIAKKAESMRKLTPRVHSKNASDGGYLTYE